MEKKQAIQYSASVSAVQEYPFDTFRIGETLYNLEVVRTCASALPVVQVELNQLRGAVSEGQCYWQDRDGEFFGPFELLQDWVAAKHNPLWHSHVEIIERADLTDPLFITKEGIVFDGMHRLTRAFLEKKQRINAAIFDALPDKAIVR